MFIFFSGLACVVIGFLVLTIFDKLSKNKYGSHLGVGFTIMGIGFLLLGIGSIASWGTDTLGGTILLIAIGVALTSFGIILFNKNK